jgi:hypothetical protein
MVEVGSREHFRSSANPMKASDSVLLQLPCCLLLYFLLLLLLQDCQS